MPHPKKFNRANINAFRSELKAVARKYYGFGVKLKVRGTNKFANWCLVTLYQLGLLKFENHIVQVQKSDSLGEYVHNVQAVKVIKLPKKYAVRKGKNE